MMILVKFKSDEREEVMKKIVLSVLLMSLAFANGQENSADASFTEIPFQQALKQSDYSYYVGSQILEGTLYYEPNSLFGYRFEFDVAKPDLEKIPTLVGDKEKGQNSRFVLNKHFKMDPQQTARAAVYLGIKTDLNDPKFTENGCSVTGPIKLHATSIGYFGPKSGDSYASIQAFRVLESGPFEVECQED